MTKDDKRDAALTIGLLGGAVLLLWGASRLLLEKPKTPPDVPSPPSPPPPPVSRPFANLRVGAVVTISTLAGPSGFDWQIVAKTAPGTFFSQKVMDEHGVGLASSVADALTGGLRGDRWRYIGATPKQPETQIFTERDVRNVLIP